MNDSDKISPQGIATICENTSERERGDYCGADGGDHDWVVSYWIGGERDENGEHVICRKCYEDYVP